MKVIEIFKSINGEGLKQGELALFIRLALCNLRCSYCDTTYSFNNPSFKNMSIDEIVAIAKDSNIKNITLTGGEPLLSNEVRDLITSLSSEGINIEIETNGSIDILPFKDINNVSFTLDYKCPSSNEEDKMNLKNYNYITKKDSVKFVVGNKIDLEKAYKIIKTYDLINKTNCMFSPVFGKIDTCDIVDFMINNNINGAKLSLQIHKFIWDPNKRGV